MKKSELLYLKGCRILDELDELLADIEEPGVAKKALAKLTEFKEVSMEYFEADDTV